jgi:hypothetical protein
MEEAEKRRIRMRKQGCESGIYRSKHDPNPLKVKSSFGPKRNQTEFEVGNRTKTKPEVPKRDDASRSAKVECKKNFIAINAIKNILALDVSAKKKKQQQQQQQAPFLGKSATHGKVPSYLSRVKAEIQAEYDELNASARRREEARIEAEGRIIQLDEVERHKALDKLKNKWDEINQQYQRQTHLSTLDTAGKIARKEKYETQLKEVERAIEILSRPVKIEYRA